MSWWKDDTGAAPEIEGYRPVAEWRCTRCSGLVRVAYRAEPGAEERERIDYHHGWSVSRYGSALSAVARPHNISSAGWPFDLHSLFSSGGCGFGLFSLEQHDRSFIDAYLGAVAGTRSSRGENETPADQRIGAAVLRHPAYRVTAVSADGWPPLVLFPAPALVRADVMGQVDLTSFSAPRDREELDRLVESLPNAWGRGGWRDQIAVDLARRFGPVVA